MFVTYMDTPIGVIEITANKTAVVTVNFCEEKGKENCNTVCAFCKLQLREYFAGTRKTFTVPLYIQGTPFQARVLKALREIPYGETRSYQEVAVMAGSPRACRAVGKTNNQNKIAILIPCHRVIGKSGTLVGYAGGLDKKTYLLELEHAYKEKR